MFNNNEILKEEFDKLIGDIQKEYNASGRKVTGNFMKEIEVTQGANSIKAIGASYLEGRAPGGQMPPVADIERWVKARGITPIKDEMSTSSLAFIIARKIAKEGTEGYDIYGKVVTPQRIDEIIKKISTFNANEFVNALQEKINKLQI